MSPGHLLVYQEVETLGYLESHSKNEGSQLIPTVCFLGPNPSNHSAFLATPSKEALGTGRYGWLLPLMRSKQRRILPKNPQEKAGASGKSISTPFFHGVTLLPPNSTGGGVVAEGRHRAEEHVPPGSHCLTALRGHNLPG